MTDRLTTQRQLHSQETIQISRRTTPHFTISTIFATTISSLLFFSM